MKRILLAFMLLFALTAAWSQTFNNSWIDYSKTYYKFSIGANGLYRISQPVLAAAGLGGTQAQHYKLFRNGQEVALYTSLASGVLNSSDYIEFYGLMNDARSEKGLYKTDDLQLCDKWSLLSDTASYFLTVQTTGTNLRYANTANNVAANVLPAETYFMHKLGRYYKNRINRGYGIDFGELVHSSSYEKGEGWSTSDISGGLSLFDLNTNLYIHYAGPSATVTSTMAGNHANTRNIALKINGNTISTGSVNGFDIWRVSNTNVPLSTFANDAANVEFANEGPSGDRIIASCYEITYPRQFNFGGESQFEFELPGGLSGKYLTITNFNYGTAAPILYDLTNNLRIVGDIGSGTLKYVLPSSADTRKLILLNAEPASIKAVSGLTQRSFVNYSQVANQGDYIIISHPLLFNDGAGNNNVDKYRQYRSSAAGGSYNAKVIQIDQLIDQFGFGIKQNPLAIRNFADFTLANFTTTPKFFFLIGKGLSYDQFRAYENDGNVNKLALVPTFGFPASDNLLTASRTGAFPRISTGRLSAIAGTEVGYYLDKIKQFELAQKSTNQTIGGKGWMKNAAHITGAIDDVSLYGLITAYMQGYEQIIGDTSFGGKVYNFSRNTGQLAIGSTKSIDTVFSEGISLLTYFGHSSPNTLEFNLDNPQNYNNTGKYPLIIVNGCNTGNLFLFDTLRPVSKGTLSEKYVFADQKGSVGFIASTHFGLPQQLNYFTAEFYRNTSNYLYGAGVGDIMKATMETITTNYSFDFIARTHAEEITFHGDPAIKVNPHSNPDYTILDSLISFNPASISVADNKVVINAKIINIGKAISDSVTIRFQHKQPDNSIVTIADRRIRATLFEDTLQVSLPLNPLVDKGVNQVIITIDPDNEIPELSETNNAVTKSFTIIEDEIRPVYPYNYSIVGNSNTALYGSTANPTIGSRQYTMEMDTSRLFNSANKIIRTVTSTGGLIKFVPGTALTDSTVYYWRLTSGPVNAQSRWLSSSFTYINGSDGGFAQANYYQFTDDEFNNISIDPATRKFDFDDEKRKLLVRAGVFPFYSWDRNNINIDSDQIDFWGCVFNNVQFYVFDSLTQKPWLNVNVGPDGRFGSQPVCNPARAFFEFPFTSPVYRKRAMDFFDSIPSGMYVAVRNLIPTSNTTFIDQWKADTATLGSGKSLWHKFHQMGLHQIDSFTTNRQFVFVFKKKDGVATEIRQRIAATVDTQISDTFQLAGKDVEGSITTPWLGPVKSWSNFKWNKKTNEDSVGTRSIDIIGKDYFGGEVVLATVYNSKDTSINFIDAATYPYLRLRMNNSDEKFAKATQLKYWMLTGSMMPEGGVAPNISFQYRDTLLPTDTLKLKVAFKNVSNVAFDSLKLKLTVRDNYGIEQVYNANEASPEFRIAPLAGGDSILISYNIPAADYSGKNQLFLDVNPDNDQPEQFHFNNVLFRNFWVIALPCPGTNVFFESGYRGGAYTYQWQVNTGSGYTNISNGAIYANTSGDSLRLTAPPTNWTGNKYRCVITEGANVYYSDEYTLRFGTRWIGTTSNAWQNPANWSCGIVPDQFTDVTIGTGVPNFPLVTVSNATCRSLTLNNGSSVIVQPGAVITISAVNPQ
jgi:Peptidase family C25/CARDB